MPSFPFLVPIGSAFPSPFRQQPDVFVQIVLTKVPASEGTEILNWAYRPLADSGVFREGKILDITSITRSSLDPDGNIQTPTVTITVEDNDGRLRRRFAAGAATEYPVNREITIFELSPEGREAGIDPVILFRGWITSVQPVPGRIIRVECGSVLGALMSRLYVDQNIGTEIGNEQGPTLPDSSKGLIYPYLLGDGSDLGATDAQGNPASTGILPVIEGHTGIVPGTAGTQSQVAFDSPVDFVAGICADGAGNIGEETWFAGCAYKNGRPITPLAYGQTGVSVPGSFTHAIDVYWNQKTVDSTIGNNLTSGLCDGFWLWRWTGGPGVFDPFTNPEPGSGVQIAFKDIPNIPDGPHSVPADGTSDFFTRFDSMPGNPWVPLPIAELDTPVITSADVPGVGGTDVRYYQVTGVTAYSIETAPSDVFIVENCPAHPSQTNPVNLVGTCPTGTSRINLYGGLINPPTQLLTTVDANGTNWNITDIGFTDPVPVTPEPAPVSPPITSSDAWTWMIASEGALTGIPQVYGSDRAQGTTPKRVLQGPEWFGRNGEILAPGHTGWPHPDNFITVGGVVQSGIYLRGVILDHHRRGIVTVTVNYCGQDISGTGTGEGVSGSLPQLQKLLEDKVLGGNPFYSNGDPILDGQAFADAQNQTRDFMSNDAGYEGTVALTEPVTLRELIRRWCESTGGQVAETRQGQIRPFFIDDTRNPDSAKYLRYGIESWEMKSQSLEWDQVKTSETASYAWSPAKNDFIVKDVPFDSGQTPAYLPGVDPDNPDLRAALVKKRQCYYINDPAIVADVCNRDLLRRARRPELATLITDMRGLQIEIGDLVKWSHPDRCSSTADFRFSRTDPNEISLGICLAHTINPNDRTVEITVRDLSTLHGITSEDQLFLFTNNEELAPLFTNTEADAPAFVL